MSLMKPRVMTPARLAASRQNAQKSTGPRTARGKAQSRLNGLRHGFCSPAYRRLWLALMDAPPGYPVAKTVVSMVTAEEYGHSVYADLIGMHFEMEREDIARERRMRWRGSQAGVAPPERSPELTENKGSGKTGASQS
jgi:hypothetical protein